MFYLSICGIVAFLTGIACAFIVYFNKPRNSLKIIWTLYSLGISVWGLGLFQLFTTDQEVTALLWGRILNLFAIFVPILFFHFVLLLTGQFAAKKKELSLYYVGFFVYLSAALINPSSYIPSVSPRGEFHFYPDAGWLYYFFPVLVFCFYSYGFLVLYSSYKQAFSIKKNQYKYFIIASLCGILGATTTLFLVFRIPIFPYGAILVPLYNLAVAYIIIKHHLMDIRIIIRRSLIYTMLISSLTVFYMVAVYILGRSFQHVMGYQSAMGSIAVFGVIAIIFVPLRNYIQSFVDRYFFKASYLQMVEQNDSLRQQVIRSQRYEHMATLSRNIINEVKRPLTALVGYGHQLPKRLDDREFLAKFTEVFEKELGQIQVLVKRLSDFSDQKQLELKSENITVLLDDTVEHVRALASDRKITFYKYFSKTKETMVNIDAKQIKQSLNNIFLCIMRTIPKEGGQVWVGMEEVDDVLEIRIKDTGHGLSTDALTKIFDPFSFEQDAEGNFGLAAVQTIIHNHGGQVLVESEEGVGTEWIIQLPCLVR